MRREELAEQFHAVAQDVKIRVSLERAVEHVPDGCIDRIIAAQASGRGETNHAKIFQAVRARTEPNRSGWSCELTSRGHGCSRTKDTGNARGFTRAHLPCEYGNPVITREILGKRQRREGSTHGFLPAVTPERRRVVRSGKVGGHAVSGLSIDAVRLEDEETIW